MIVEPLGGQAKAAVDNCDARWNIWDGAVRSSKTISSLLAWLEFVRTGPGGPLLMTGRTERTLKRNIIDTLVDMLGPSRCRLVAGSGELWLLGRRVYLVGANDEVAQEKIRGLTLAGAYVDEASTIPESFWAMLATRLSIPGARCYATTNPDGPRHWLKLNYLDRAKLTLRDAEVVAARPRDDALDLHRFRFRLADNPTLSADYVAALDAEFVGLWRRRLIDGEWSLASGVVYDMFDEDRHVIDEVPELRALLACAMDYGATNPTHALVIGLAATGELVVTREYRHDPVKAMKALTIDEVADEIGAWLAPDRPAMTAVDPSAKALRVQLERDPRFRSVRGADNSVLDGIMLVASLLSSNRLLIHSSCGFLIEELGSYAWDDQAAKRGEDKPVKFNDHACLVGDTPVLTREGWRRIDEVIPGDQVATRDGWRPVTAAGMTAPAATVYDVELSNGATLTATGNHPVLTTANEWKRVDSLRYSDILVGWQDESKWSCSTGSSSGDIQTPSDGLNDPTSCQASQTDSAEPAACMRKCGSPTTARSQAGATFTTVTTTLSTTPPTTSWRRTAWNIMRTTLPTASQAVRTRLPSTWRIWKPSDPSPLNGIGQKRGVSGPVRTLSRTASGGARCGASDALTAAAPTRQRRLVAETSSARTLARAPRGARRESMTSSASVSAAASRSGLTATASPDFADVRVLRVTERNKQEPVWNVTVAGRPEYVAAGVIVHNCDALRYGVATTQPLWRNAPTGVSSPAKTRSRVPTRTSADPRQRPRARR